MLGSVLNAARKKSGITIQALAERTEITEQYLYRIENEGKSKTIPRYHQQPLGVNCLFCRKILL